MTYSFEREYVKSQKTEQSQKVNDRAIAQSDQGSTTTAHQKKQTAIVDATLGYSLRQLSDLGTLSEKAKLKKSLLIQYEDEVSKWLKSNNIEQNNLFIYCMIWTFDIGDTEKGLALALIAIKREQSMPERFNRDVKAFVADTVFDAFDVNNSNQSQFDFILEQLTTGAWLVHEAIQCKYYKKQGELLFNDDPVKALEFFKKAEEIYPKKARVKGNISKLEKIITKERSAK